MSNSIELALGKERRSGRRVPLIVVLVLVVSLVSAAIGWAIATVFSPPDEVLGEQQFTTVEVVHGEVGSSITLNTVAAWTPVPVGSNQAVGTVTSIDMAAGDEVSAGAVLYTVDLRPVVIGQGEVPAFRDLSSETAGADVSQLQSMLQSLGFYEGPVDGLFGSGVTSAVREWQESLRLAQTGVVQEGDVMFVPTLPVRVTFDAQTLSRGTQLVGGEQMLSGLPSSPEFTIPVTATQAPLIPIGTRILITGPNDEEWLGLAGEQSTGEGGTITVVLQGQDGARICDELCGELPVTEPSLLRSEIVTVEAVQGLTVPTAALRSGADGSTVVVDKNGQEHPVEIVTSARGLSIIEGVEAGLFVRVPAVED